MTVEQFRDHAGPALLSRGGPLIDVLMQVLAGAHRGTHEAITATAGGDHLTATFQSHFGSTDPNDGALLAAAFDGRFGPAWTDQWRSGTGRPGTPQALLDAITPTLRGTRQVTLLERDGGDPHAVRVQVFSSEVIDLAVTEQAATSQLPDGLLLTVQVMSGATYDHMTAAHGPTYEDFAGDFPTYDDARDHVPEV